MEYMKGGSLPDCCVIISGSMADFEGIPAIGNSYLDDDEEEEEEKEVESGEDDNGELEGDVSL